MLGTMGIVILICLLTGPNARWVKRFLPNTPNRIVFLIIVIALIVAYTVLGIGSVSHGERGEGYFTLTVAALCGIALYRFIYDWWLRAQKPLNP